MKRAANVEWQDSSSAGAAGEIGESTDRGTSSGNDELVRRVDVRELNTLTIHARFDAEVSKMVGIQPQNRGHGAVYELAGRGHCRSPDVYQLEGLGIAQCARSDAGGEFTNAVAGHGHRDEVRAESFAQNRQGGQAGGDDGGLGNLSGGEPFQGPLLAEAGDWQAGYLVTEGENGVGATV